MNFTSMSLRSLRNEIVVLLCLLALSFGATAQSRQAQLAAVPPSRVDLFGGYGYFHPYAGSVAGYTYQPIDLGAVTSLSAYFTRHLGLTAEGGFHPDGPNDCVYTAQGGPVLRTNRGHFVPFIHVLGGGAKIGGPVFQPCTWGWGVTAGAGIDYVLPHFENHLALRLVQADWQYSHVEFGALNAAHVAGGTADLRDIRLASGVVLRFGSTEKVPPIQTTCSLRPETVFVGDPVMVSVATRNLDRRRQASYVWSTTGGKINGTGEAVTVDTTGLAAGSYAVTAAVTQGNKLRQKAGCKASFSVRSYEPPTLECVANPSRIMPGDPSLITANGVSPQNRHLLYTFAPDQGQVANQNGNTATLDSRGVPVGTITVTCKVADDLGQQATAVATVTILPPPPPPPPPTQALCSIAFVRDHKRPTRVDNEAKGCLDDIALTLTSQPDAKLTIVAHADAKDKPDAAAQRAINTKQYLVHEKGIDASRIELRTGLPATRAVDSTLIPPGATFSGEDTTPIDAPQ